MRLSLPNLLIVFILFGLSTNAHAVLYSYDFEYGGMNWGTMDITINYTSDIMEVTYTASSSPSIPAGSEATGFGFDFNPDLSPIVFNSATPPDYVDPDPTLTWIELTNLNALPNPANTGTVFWSDFTFGVTEGNSNNLNPPGILPGNSDTFYLDFSGFYDLVPSENIVNLVSVRLQSLPDNINGGSLLLVGTPTEPIPEPATMLLFGTGLAGLAAVARKRK